ncbi:butyrophilin subfamily 2 member A2-like isoform X5 [Oncorhynchus clarkii lewisi]|uniref:butyrophilin subfamily 2 member A2-like isoform X5 n=1 Tax=Oncorhynchus clarkii lewisi TaxID=490388 RepID=UPI0039B9CC72
METYRTHIVMWTVLWLVQVFLCASGITVADNGMYKCFFQTETLVYIHITLHVIASYSVCMYQVLDQASMGSGWGERFGVYQCKANGGYPKGQIHWKMGGHPLVNTSRRDETHLDNSTGLYSLTSILTMDRSQGEKLQCMVENTDQASKLNSTCKEKPVYIRESPLESPDKVAVAAGVSVSVVVMLVAGVLLVIFLLTRCHRRETSTKQSDTEDRSVTQQLNMYEH